MKALLSRSHAALAMSALLWAWPLGATAATLHVSPSGNDAWSGRLDRPNAERTDGPLASLEGARDAVRRLKAQAPLTEPVRVLFADGVYPVRGPVAFTPEDSGTEACPITYEAAPGATPVFHGGREIRGFQRGPDGVWAAQVPLVATGRWYFEQLWVNGRRATRARSPNRFYYYLLSLAPPVVDPQTGEVHSRAYQAFRARQGDVKPWPNLQDVVVVAYNSWETSRNYIGSFDPDTDVVALTGSTVFPFAYWGPNQRYHLENFREALDAPGEWFLDRGGTLYYKPLPGEDITQAEVVAPVAEQFLILPGDPDAGRLVEHVSFRGLRFRYGQYVLPSPKATADGQAAASAIPAAIHGRRRAEREPSRAARSATSASTASGSGAAASDCRVQR
jgi:hypothetical protein